MVRKDPKEGSPKVGWFKKFMTAAAVMFVGAVVTNAAPSSALTPPRGVPSWTAQFGAVNGMTPSDIRDLPYGEVPAACKSLPKGLPVGSVVYFNPNLRVTGALAQGTGLKVGTLDAPEGLSKTLQIKAPAGPWRVRAISACNVTAFGGDEYGSWGAAKKFASPLSATLTVDAGDGSYAVTVMAIAVVFGPPPR